MTNSTSHEDVRATDDNGIFVPNPARGNRSTVYCYTCKISSLRCIFHCCVPENQHNISLPPPVWFLHSLVPVNISQLSACELCLGRFTWSCVRSTYPIPLLEAVFASVPLNINHA